MNLRVLVEGPSDKRLLDPWLARLLPRHRIQVLQHQGKGRLPKDLTARPDPRRTGLLDQLPAKLRAYEKSLQPGADAVVILVDADDEPCADLKREIVDVVKASAPNVHVLVRIAVEETEAFYLGDWKGLRKAFPSASAARHRQYHPDSIGQTWEVFSEVIDASREDKVRWADAMAPHLTTDPKRTKSPSHRALIRGLLRVVGEVPP